MESTVHINIGYVISLFALIGVIAGFLLWVLKLVLLHTSKQQATDSIIIAIQKEIDQLKTDKVSKIDFVSFTSELRHIAEKVEELRQLIISLSLSK